MSAPTDPNAALWDDLVTMYAATDPVPAEVTLVAHGALAITGLDAALALLVDDSVEHGLALTRSADGAGRLLTFQSDQLVIEVQVSVEPGGNRLVGQLVPVGPAEVSAEWPAGSSPTAADQLGRFTLGGVPSGPVRLVCRRPDVADVTTEWLTL